MRARPTGFSPRSPSDVKLDRGVALGPGVGPGCSAPAVPDAVDGNAGAIADRRQSWRVIQIDKPRITRLPCIGWPEQVKVVDDRPHLEALERGTHRRVGGEGLEVLGDQSNVLGRVRADVRDDHPMPGPNGGELSPRERAAQDRLAGRDLLGELLIEPVSY